MIPKPIIDAPGKYLTRGGEEITIKEVGGQHPLPRYAKKRCLGTFPDGIVDYWDHFGRFWTGLNSESKHDIVKKL